MKGYTITRNFVVIGEKVTGDTMLDHVTVIFDYFETLKEAETYTGIEALQSDNEGVTFHIYRREA
jgi:hypothetical protein